jgi:hypothetical protein
MTDIVERLRSRAWEDRHHRKYREEAALEIVRLRAELEQWTTWGVIEVAMRNPSVSEYMRHWEGRATKAEAERDALQDRILAALDAISDGDEAGAHLILYEGERQISAARKVKK